MSQMPDPAGRPVCPECAEPLESGDLFCGACGHDLADLWSASPPAGDRPTLVMNHTPAAAVQWPSAPGTERGTDRSDAPGRACHAEELPVLESDGSRLPPHTGDFELPAPAPAAARIRGGEAAAVADTDPTPPGGTPTDAPGTGGTSGTDSTAGPGGTGGESATGAAPGGGSAVDPRTTTPVPGSVPVGPPAPGGGAGAKLCVACRTGRVDADGYCENCGHAQPRERDHMERELGSVAAVSDRGLRHHRNEDAFAVSSAALPDGSPAVVAVVCDGVSSATRPDDASAAAAASADESLLAGLERGTHPQQAMHDAIVAAAEAVTSLAAYPPSALDEPHRHQNAPACTIVAAVVANGLLTVGWIGDSRVYWVPDDRGLPPARLTEDDSWAAQMVAAGLMNEAEAYADARAHAITGWLGADAYEVEPHTASFKPDHSGVVVVCTDGLWNYAEGADEMAGALPDDAAARPLHAARVLVGHALDGGGHDNVTVAVLPFAVPPQAAESACATV
ncbi:PP2C family serine/threonine-protein phosphatase [Streptomyces sp. NRRL F-5135]|uniref:PP2C family serine/threonine-protein phosphatase n=1 Tax=Streptomyces sp. NRRL F-5135 TaxID=1463858 RepID=UPI000691E04D|nr:protein phosphatase 2C domain-containing protein [Streptomyces sp. NRRL F-5135]